MSINLLIEKITEQMQEEAEMQIRNQKKSVLQLQNLEKLKKLQGFRFCDLNIARQRRFKRTTIRIIQLSEDADEETRRDLFERINTGSVQLNEMEKRRGIIGNV